MKKIIFGIIILFGIQSCNSVDDSNPNDLLKNYIDYGFNKSYEKRHELISTDSKKICSLGEYLNYYEKPDSLTPINNVLLSIKELQAGKNYPSYKRFRTKTESIMENNDTLKYLSYWTLKNENNHWRVVWWGNILQQSEKKYNNGDFDGTIKLCEKIIKLDPYAAVAYSKIGWCYYRDQSKSLNKRKELMLKNFKYTISLEPDIPDHYNSLASYYSIINISELQIENFKKAIKLSYNEKQRSYLYANMSGVYLFNNNIKEAFLNIKKAVSLDSTSSFNWFKYGVVLMFQKKNNEAKIKFEKAIELPPMENALQFGLFASYAQICYEEKDLESAKTYILKALELNPSDKWAISLYNKITKEKTQ